MTKDPANPLSAQGANLRCFYNKRDLFEVARYVDGYRRLRPGREDMVVFGAIAGVPADLVSAQARAGVDFTDHDQRDRYYAQLLEDERMQERPLEEQDKPPTFLTPSCDRRDASGGREPAYPPRRIVEVAREFGANGFVQSICQDDLTPAIDTMVDVFSRQFFANCLPVALERGRDGKVDCDVVWELPRPGTAPESTPTACSARAFLSPRPGAKLSSRGGQTCLVEQISLAEAGTDPAHEGFYYDDRSAERAELCPSSQRIAFTPGAEPPSGVRAILDCSRGAER